MNLATLAAKSVDMVPHVATLTRLAKDAGSIVELGVRTGVSTWALLDGLPADGRMTSVDILDVVPGLDGRITGDSRWRFVQGDDREPLNLPAADLVFVDTSHEYHHTLAELGLADGLGASRIILHDWNLPDVQDAAHGFLRRTNWLLWLIEPSQWGLAVLGR